MSLHQQKLKQNVEQQTKRLLSQLEELNTLKEELTQQEYLQMRESTLAQLEIFQQSLDNMTKDPSNSMFESDFQKTKRLIYEAVKSKFDKNEIKSKILESQVQGIRIQIKKIDDQYHLKKISQRQYMKSRRNLVVKLEEASVELTKQETQWLQTHQNFEFKNESDENFKETQIKELKSLQESIKKDL